MILDMLAKGKISVEQAEALLEALNGHGTTARLAPGMPTGLAAPTGLSRGRQREEATCTVPRAGEADARSTSASSPTASPKWRRRWRGRAGASHASFEPSDSLVNLASRFGYNAEVTLEGLVEQDREIRRIDLSTTNGSIKLRGGDAKAQSQSQSAGEGGGEPREAQSILEEGLNLALEDGTLSLDCADKSILSSCRWTWWCPRAEAMT